MKERKFSDSMREIRLSCSAPTFERPAALVAFEEAVALALSSFPFALPPELASAGEATTGELVGFSLFSEDSK